MRDFTRNEFRAKLKQYGMKPRPTGFYAITFDNKGRDKLLVFGRNGGKSLRYQLAYLIAKQKKEVER